MWNWKNEKWPNFQWDASKFLRSEKLFSEGSGVISGASGHMLTEDQRLLSIQLISTEALDTSEIEGEYLNLDSVQSSVRRELGLKGDKRRSSPAESGVAEMMVNLYKTLSDPLTESTLFEWHPGPTHEKRQSPFLVNLRQKISQKYSCTPCTLRFLIDFLSNLASKLRICANSSFRA